MFIRLSKHNIKFLLNLPFQNFNIFIKQQKAIKSIIRRSILINIFEFFDPDNIFELKFLEKNLQKNGLRSK